MQGAEQAELHKRRAREWGEYRKKIHRLCNLAEAGKLAFEVRRTRRGVEAVRFGSDNVWHANIPQHGAEKPKPA